MKKETNSSQQDLLGLLKRLEQADKRSRRPATQELAQRLIHLCGTPERASLITRIPAPTLYRWAQGNSAPRNISRLKATLADPNFENQIKRFSGSFDPVQEAGIHSIRFFLERARLASKVFIFQSFLGFEFAHSERLQQQMEELLEANQDLTIHCIFPSKSKADEMLERFCELARSFDQHWITRIKRHSIDDNEQVMALGLGLTGQLILVYTAEGRKQFGGRYLDLLVEVPVRVYEQSEPGVFIKRNIWIELPQEEIQSIWQGWKAFLEAKKILPAERSTLQRIV